MNIRPNRLLTQRGTGLVEVLVVILVLGIGMLSMAKIHALIVRDGGSANNRAIAMQLAQYKIDELRGFKCPQFVAGSACTNAGGESDFVSIAGGNDTVSTLDGTNLNESFTRTWAITSWYLCPDVADADGDGDKTESLPPANANCGKAYPDYKTVVATVTWTDSNGAQSVSLTTSIYSTDAYSMAEASGGVGTSFTGPRVSYTPIGVPDSVPVNIGDNNSKESSQATPKVTQGGDTTAVYFDQTTYATANNTTISQDEWVTISCICDFNGNGAGMTPTREVWNHAEQQFEAELGVSVNKAVGSSNPTGAINTLEEQLCADCCRDHHDTSGASYPKYDPVRFAADPNGNFEANGDHKHYRDSNNNGVLEANESVTAGEYLEACRFKRVNGIFRLYPDWRLVDLTVMPRDGYLENNAPQAAYVTYLDTALTHYGLNSGAAPDKANLSDRNFVQLIQGQHTQLLARALYIDTIYNCRYDASNPSHCANGSNPTVADANHPADVLALKAAGQSWKKHLSFAEVNLTLFSNWSSNQPTRVSVTDETVDSIVDPINDYYGSYSRGLVEGGANLDAAVITATSRRGNTSLTSGVTANELSIDFPDQTETLSDSITVTRVGNVNNDGTVNGELVKRDAQGPTTFANGDILKTNGVGVVCSGGAGTDGPAFSCTVPAGWTGDIWFVKNPHEFYTCAADKTKTEITAANPLHFINVAAGGIITVPNLIACKGACNCP